MESKEVSRAEELASKALTLLRSGQNEEASRLLREAISISPDSLKVKAAFAKMQSDLAVPSILQSCRKFTTWNDQNAGKEAVNCLYQSAGVPDEAGEQCLKLLYANEAQSTSVHDELFAALVRKNTGARKYLARILHTHSTTEVFNRVRKIGQQSSDGLLNVVLDSSTWPSEEARQLREDDLFVLLLAKLLEAGNANDAGTIKGLALLLAHDADRLSHLIDSDCFEAILTSLDMRLPVETRSQATLVTAKFLEASQKHDNRGQRKLADFITGKVANGTDEERIVAFSAAAAVFPIVPSVASGLFLTAGFVESLVTMLQSRSDKTQRGVEVSQAALEMFSAACIDQACREAIVRHASGHLEDWADKSETQASASGTASVILAKIRGAKDDVGDDKTSKVEDVTQKDTKMDGLVLRFKSMMETPSSKAGTTSDEQNAIEGLAYASLQPTVKESLARDSAFLTRLTALLSAESLDTTTNTPALTFGILTILANLTTYPPPLSEEQKRMADLKAYANTKKPLSMTSDPLMSDESVSARCHALLCTPGLVPRLVTWPTSRSTPIASPTTLSIILTILLSLSQSRGHRGKLVQYGALKLLLLVTSPSFPQHLKTAQSQHTASHALARILISLDPALVFPSASSSSQATTAIRPLLSLMRPADQEHTGPANLLPTYEALLALTNLATHSPPVTFAIASLLFPAPLDPLLLLHGNTLIQRAAIELVCNTASTSPTADAFSPAVSSAQSLQDTAARKQRLHILLALTDAQDKGTRLAAGGAIAGLTGWDSVVLGVLQRQGGIEAIVRMINPSHITHADAEHERAGEAAGEADDALAHRGLVALRNMVLADGEAGARSVKAARELGAVEMLKRVLVEKKENSEMLAIGVETLKALMP